MGITIAYRGRLAEPARIEDFEDRLLDFALEVGGMAQIWRSNADDDPARVVRGILLNVAPGHETASLLVSPEGWLIGLTDIEDAEAGRLTEPPWCFVKTQFGPLEGHVALVEMFAALGREFLADLEVRDEGGYWETRDLGELTRRRGLLNDAIEQMADHLRSSRGLSAEAAEDPALVLRHIERIAEQVHRTLRRPSEHPPVTFPEDVVGEAPDPDETEAQWDALFKHNRRQQERLQRALEERRSRGEDDEDAFESALGDLGLEAPDDPADETDAEELFDEAAVGAGDAEPFADERERHPLLERATDLMVRLHKTFATRDPQHASAIHTLFQGAGDMAGGLAQGLRDRDDEDDPDQYGLNLTQLKRAMRGVAFARGALFALRSAVAAEEWSELQRALGQLESDIFQEIARLRSDQPGE